MAQLTPRQERAIVALLKARSVLLACKRSGVARRTMENWLRTPDFVAALKSARQRVHSNSLGRLCQESTRAANILIDSMRGKPITNMQRLCARDILTFAREGLNADTSLRVDEIETKLERFLGGTDA